MIRLAALSVSLLLTACATTRAPAPSQPPDALLWFRTSAEMKAIYEQTYRLAAERVREAAAGRTSRTWAVILDADETILDNSEYQQRLYTHRAGFDEQSWASWVAEARAPALPGAKAFIATVQQLGGQIIIVTNRGEANCPVTTQNLITLGIKPDRVLCAPPGVSNKNPRFESVRTGNPAGGIQPLEVLAYVGDNIQDFPRRTQQQPGGLEEIGLSQFVLPNPLYGSWGKNALPAR